jgi:alkylhydroperoxidase family enzyme
MSGYKVRGVVYRKSVFWYLAIWNGVLFPYLSFNPMELIMSRIALSETGATPWERLLGNAPTILEKWVALEHAFMSSPTFSDTLREQVRRALAFGNRCDYCMAKAGPPDESQPDRRTSLAVGLAQRFVQDHRNIDTTTFEALRAEFSEKELCELFAYMSFFCASQMFGASLGLQPAEEYSR